MNQQEKKSGNYRLDGDRIRVTYSEGGTDSVLIDEIASVSLTPISVPNPLVMLICVFIACLVFFVGFLAGFLAILAGIVVGAVLMIINSTKYENVGIETMGGKIIYFTLELGKGHQAMEDIENIKRNYKK
jgi:uncharacterized membrane protein